MKISSFLAKIAVIAVMVVPFAPVQASTIGLGLGSALGDSIHNAIGNVVTCSIEASTKLVGVSNNEVTYKIKYTSNYLKLNSNYNLQAGSPDNFLHQKGGAFAMDKGTYYIALTANNGTEMKFTYPVKGNPSVELQANVDGIRCTGKTLQTIQPKVNGINSAVTVNSNINLNDVNVNKEMAPVVIALQPQIHTCQILAEAAKLDNDTLQIGAGVKFENLAIGKFNYSVRGYLSTAPSQVKEYAGVYTNASAGATGNVLNNGKGFLFTFDSKTSADKYVVAATIGNIDCKLVYFASPIVVPVQINPVVGENVLQPNGAVVNNPPAGNNQPSGAQVNNNPAVLGNGGAGSGSVAGQAGGSSVAPTEGLDAAGQAEAASLDLIAQADEDESTSAVVGDEEETYVADDMNVGREPDYIMYALLGSIFLSIVAAIILKTKGMM